MTTDFIEIYEHALRPELCEEIRHRFEASDRKSDGRIGHGVDKSKKNSTDITITGLSEWSDLHSQILDSTLRHLMLYIRKYPY
ncbi:MAG: 2OG-Fe(II) oxygenase, partial [Microcystis sp. M53600_WE12]|nr:2OG-Fe(II) oxygenase [Microcystis sp. M53600_WE12]